MTVSLDARTADVVSFIERTIERGVPARVALTRAHRRYGIDRDYLRAVYRYVHLEGS